MCWLFLGTKWFFLQWTDRHFEISAGYYFVFGALIIKHFKSSKNSIAMHLCFHSALFQTFIKLYANLKILISENYWIKLTRKIVWIIITITTEYESKENETTAIFSEKPEKPENRSKCAEHKCNKSILS